ncbi:hypothetical protein [Mucilaginibacter sp. 3215]|uniref:hypothetical protein n=1 Tax=Mucilaginibacter sp. 3215 TaxID=3373912 RepID=UPI003D249318
MVLLTATTDWISAVTSTLAIFLTIYALYSTRKDGLKVQEQIDSLRKLADINEKIRRDDVLPRIIIESVGYNQGHYHTSEILLRNDGEMAQNFKILSADFIDFFKIPITQPETTFSKNTHIKIQFSLNGLPNHEVEDKLPIIIVVQFKSLDGEYFRQILEVNKNSRFISNPPILISQLS